ncbi:MAG: cytochrome c oxidase subunit 3 [Chitinophagales bacterium]|nr:cytochrome c oxidase subunit 3 [Chitinophagales bacterium]MDW8272621.1 cytochrome c oxidase subunit 3 [Chitinophagales bacterium]
MATATIEHSTGHVKETEQELWKGGRSPFKAGYGKIMMWYFLISDTFTFACLLITYGALRFTLADNWPKPAEVFSSIPLDIFHGVKAPLVFVSFMTFLLIVSSYTMVRAVQEGYLMNKWGVVKFIIPTAACGALFLFCQYLEWTHLIHEGMTATTASPTTKVVNFGQLFFVITGFHGLHVLGGVILLTWLLIATINGRFEKVGHYEMVEKIGLYWHFVDLVWVYVFLCFYLL